MENNNCDGCPLGNGNKYANWAKFKQKIELEIQHQAEEDKEMKKDIKFIKRFMIGTAVCLAAYFGIPGLKVVLGLIT